MHLLLSQTWLAGVVQLKESHPAILYLREGGHPCSLYLRNSATYTKTKSRLISSTTAKKENVHFLKFFERTGPLVEYMQIVKAVKQGMMKVSRTDRHVKGGVYTVHDPQI